MTSDSGCGARTRACRVDTKSLWLPVAFIALTVTAHAGVITGSVLEEASGRPLARTIVRLQAVSNVISGASSSERPKQPFETRTSTSGAFTFPIVPDGLYLIVATRAYYFPSYYGQRRPDGQGLPITVTGDSSLFAQIRMRRMGVITGRVLDENDIGITNVTVVAYRARFPLRVAGRGVSDDRGVYRIFNLDPGKYWVRSTAAALDDGAALVPTYGLESLETRDARWQDVHVDQETAFADLRPIAGRLFSINAVAQCPVGNVASLALSSETDRRTVNVACGNTHRFDGLSPGPYELVALSENLAGFVERHFDREQLVAVSMGQMPRVDIDVRPSRPSTFVLNGHRQDLAETEKDRPITLPGLLAPGHWVMNATVGPTQYVEEIQGSSFGRRLNQPPDTFDVMIQGYTRISVRVSDQAAQMEGSVLGADSKPVPGAPVFIYAVTESARRSIGGSRQTVTGIDGRYQLTGLPPGDYRIIATFDIREIDADILDNARIDVTRLAIGEKKTADLPLWIAP
jgi:hypothetical protein